MMSIYSALVTNLIGIIYVDGLNENLRFAYLDFMGNRQHLDLKITDVSQPKDHKKISQVTLFNVKSGKETKEFKLLPRYGDVYDKDLFLSLFEKKTKE